MSRPLEDILTEYEEVRGSYRHFTKVGDNNKHTLIEFQGRFIDLKSELRGWRSKIMGEYTLRDEKACTAIKFRIAVAMVRDEYVFEEGEKPMYDRAPAIGNAEKFASATHQYKEFLRQRTFAKESLANISDLREDLSGYINEIKDRLK